MNEATELITIEGPGPLAPIAGPIDWSRPLQTKGSFGIHQAVRIIAIDHSLNKPVIGVIGKDKNVSVWHYNGQYNFNSTGAHADCLDLENVPEVAA